MDIKKALADEYQSLAHQYALHDLPVCVYGSTADKRLLWAQSLANKHGNCIVVENVTGLSHNQQAGIANNAQTNKYIFCLEHDPATLVANGNVIPILGVVLCTLPIELVNRSGHP